MSSPGPDDVLVYVGTYTTRETFVDGKAAGIHILRLDLASGALREVAVSAPVVNPSYLVLHPSGGYLFTVNEVYTPEGGAVSAYAIDAASGNLTFLNQQPSHGGAPCHLALAGNGRALVVANYQTGSVAVLPVGDDGRLGAASDVLQHVGSSVNAQRQQGPHAHSVTFDPTGRFVFVCDLGLDKVLIYRFDDAQGKLLPHATPWAVVRAGAGPRHLDIHPNGRWVYAINELDSTIDAFAFDRDAGTLRAFQHLSTLPPDFRGTNHCADLHVAPSGRFVYGSNRGHDSIAVFVVDDDTGRLSRVGHTATDGRTPRNFAIDPTGVWIFAANQDSDSIVPFRIDPANGLLERAGPAVSVPTPVCVRIMPVAARR
jgi:6-phosphogluconolactonase